MSTRLTCLFPPDRSFILRATDALLTRKSAWNMALEFLMVCGNIYSILFHQMSCIQIAHDVPDTPDKTVCDMVASTIVWRFFYFNGMLFHFSHTPKIASKTFTQITSSKTTVNSTSSQNLGQTKVYYLSIILVLFQRQHLTWLDFYPLFNRLNSYLGFFAPPP